VFEQQFVDMFKVLNVGNWILVLGAASIVSIQLFDRGTFRTISAQKLAKRSASLFECKVMSVMQSLGNLAHAYSFGISDFGRVFVLEKRQFLKEGCKLNVQNASLLSTT